MARLEAENLLDPIEALLLMTVIEHPLGHLEASLHVLGILEHAVPELQELIVLSAETCRQVPLPLGSPLVTEEFQDLSIRIVNLIAVGLDPGQELQPFTCLL